MAKSITSQSKSYIVLEVPSVCREFSEEFSNDSEVSFFSSILDAPEWKTSHTDILYSNSVLQYFEDNSTLIELVSLLQPEWVLMDDFLLSSNQTFYTLQNYYGIDIPCRFSEISEIEKSFTVLGYQLMFKTNYVTQIANGWEFRVEGNNKFGSEIGPSVSLLFKRLHEKK